MNILIGITAVIIMAVSIGILLQKKGKSKSFKEIVKQTFPEYIIMEKNKQIMICEYNHRNEPDERVFIRIGGKKKIEKSGRFIIAIYPTQPSSKELKKDLGKFL